MNNIIRHQTKITHADRIEALSQKPCVLWFTGLSGSGKSTIASEVESELFKINKIAYILDGDNLRLGLNSDLSFSEADRCENVRRITEVAALLMDAGLFVITSAISPSRAARNAARERLSDAFIEIYVKADVMTCIKRDPKGLYKKAIDGDIQSFTGISSSYEPPESPEIILNTDTTDINGCVKKILEYLHTRGI